MPLDARLTKLLTEKEVHADINAWLERTGVSNMDDLATLVETQAEIKVDVVGQTSQRDNMQQVFRVKQAWRIARDEWDRRSERRRREWTEDMMDDPRAPEERRRAASPPGRGTSARTASSSASRGRPTNGQ